jgi:hypothetical protein
MCMSNYMNRETRANIYFTVTEIKEYHAPRRVTSNEVLIPDIISKTLWRMLDKTLNFVQIN